VKHALQHEEAGLPLSLPRCRRDTRTRTAVPVLEHVPTRGRECLCLTVFVKRSSNMLHDVVGIDVFHGDRNVAVVLCGPLRSWRQLSNLFGATAPSQRSNANEEFLELGTRNWSIHEDIPDPDSDGPEFSMPGELLWEHDITDVTVPEAPGQGLQDWANLPEEVWRPGDHLLFMQANMIDIEDPLIQREGATYWIAANQFELSFCHDVIGKA
jgi:hypothetical protein